MKSNQTRVTFRKWRSNSDVIAIFPDLEGAKPGLCLSYEHIGQHGDCSPQGLIQASTTPASPNEYHELLRELTGIGYSNLRIVTRVKRYWWHS